MILPGQGQLTVEVLNKHQRLIIINKFCFKIHCINFPRASFHLKQLCRLETFFHIAPAFDVLFKSLSNIYDRTFCKTVHQMLDRALNTPLKMIKTLDSHFDL